MDSFGRAGAQCGGFHWIRNIAIRLQGKVCAAEFKGV
jgi:hypothetical protein